MRILFALNHFLPGKVAGTEVYTLSLAKVLQTLGHEVGVILPHYDTSVDDSYSYEDLAVYRYAEPNTINAILRAGKRAPDGIKAFIKCVKDIAPDLVSIQEMNTSSGIGLYHLKALRALEIPTVVTMHLAAYSCYCGTLMYKDVAPCDGKIRIGKCTRCALSRLGINAISQKLLYNASMPLYGLKINAGNVAGKVGSALSYPFIIKRLKDRLHEIIALSGGVIVIADWFRKVLLLNGLPNGKIHFIPQGLPYAEGIQSSSTTEHHSPLRLVFIGRIDPVKGLHILLDALLLFDVQDIQLSIYGMPADQVYLRALKKKCRVNIYWKGVIKQEQIIEAIQQHDAVVLPSIVCEMAPLLIQEAFAACVPVIGTDVKGIAEQIHHCYNGLLFSMGNMESLADILKKVLQDRTILTALKNNIKPPRSFKQVSDETLEVYQSIVGKKELTSP